MRVWGWEESGGGRRRVGVGGGAGGGARAGGTRVGTSNRACRVDVCRYCLFHSEGVRPEWYISTMSRHTILVGNPGILICFVAFSFVQFARVFVLLCLIICLFVCSLVC